MLNYKQSPRQLDAEEEWLVMLDPQATDANIEQMCHVAKNGCNLAGRPSQGGVPFVELRGTEEDLATVLRSAEGQVQFVEIDGAVHAIPELSSDDAKSGLWGLERVGAYQRTSTGSGVSVFVLDTGVRHSHRDFGGRAVSGADYSSGRLRECNGASNCAGDAQGHGTHCAGTAAGTSYGVAPQATIRSIKVLSDQGSGQWSWIVGGLDWAARNSARPAVASMSLGGPGTNQALATAVDSATRAGVSVVVAAGNDNSDSCGFSPAYVPSAITVGSTDSRDRRSSFSNYGRCTNIWAPGSSILSAGHRSDTGTATLSGTSMACPHVSGGAALVLQRNPSFNSAKVLSTLQEDAINGAISDLRAGDTNKLLYVGGGSPSPPTPPAPTPPSPPAPTPSPPGGSGCMHETDCSVSAWCRDTSFEQWCRNQGQSGHCPAPFCRQAGR